MPTIKVRQIFSHHALARLEYDEPVAAHDAGTGIELHYRSNIIAAANCASQAVVSGAICWPSAVTRPT